MVFLIPLGTGSYSSVYKVMKISDGKFYALKKVRLDNLKEKDKVNALNEVRIMASIRHPNIITYKESFLDDKTKSLWYLKPSSLGLISLPLALPGLGSTSIIMDFAEKGDLLSQMKN